MNTYRTEFFARCPVNGVHISYSLKIETQSVIRVEDIIDAVVALDSGFHEDIADLLLVRFGGLQTLGAAHHGVNIETTRGGP